MLGVHGTVFIVCVTEPSKIDFICKICFIDAALLFTQTKQLQMFRSASPDGRFLSIIHTQSCKTTDWLLCLLVIWQVWTSAAPEAISLTINLAKPFCQVTCNPPPTTPLTDLPNLPSVYPIYHKPAPPPTHLPLYVQLMILLFFKMKTSSQLPGATSFSGR